MKQKRCSTGFGSQCPPDEAHVRVYFLQQGSVIDEATRFYCHYKAKRWRNVYGEPLKNWKRLAWSWVWYTRYPRHSTTNALDPFYGRTFSKGREVT